MGRATDGFTVQGDPLIQAFDRSLFFFHGEPGRVYNFASIADGFQVGSQIFGFVGHGPIWSLDMNLPDGHHYH